MIFNELEEFKKEFKKLSKKYNSLENDFFDLKLLLEKSPT
jgi:archaellum component FlaC